MVGATGSVLLSLVILLGLIVVHELGHYLTAGLAGIPASDRRIVWLALPPHVALADGSDWVSPFSNDRFSAVYDRYDPKTRYGNWYNASGLLSQTVIVIIGVILSSLTYPPIGYRLARLSLGFILIYVIIDIVATTWRGTPFGDIMHLWRLDRRWSIGVWLFTVGSHIVMLGWLNT